MMGPLSDKEHLYQYKGYFDNIMSELEVNGYVEGLGVDLDQQIDLRQI